MAGVIASGRVRAVIGVLVGVLLAGVAAAQPGSVAPPPPGAVWTQGGTGVLPVQAQDPPAVVPKAEPPDRTADPLSPALPPAPPPSVTLAQPVFGDPLPPLPGSVEDQYEKELDARRRFQGITWTGTTFTALPNSLLWESPLAVKKEPRMQALLTNLENYRSNHTLDTSIGMTMGLLRMEPVGADFAAQLDIFGSVITRLSPDDLLAADYRFGLPVSFRWGWLQAKVAYEHTSAHLGDELIRQTGRVTRSFAKDELVIGVGRIHDDTLRLYAHLAYAFNFQVPDVSDIPENRFRFDVGGEWFLRKPTGWGGSPFAAVNMEWRGDQGHQPNFTAQAGWFWRNPTQRLGTLRVFAEHYHGFSPYGQLMAERERFYSFGFGFDY